MIEESKVKLTELPSVNFPMLLGREEKRLKWSDGEFETTASISATGAIVFWKMSKLGVVVDLRSTRLVNESEWPNFAIENE